MLNPSPFPIHPVNLNNAQLAAYGHQIYTIGLQVREEAMKDLKESGVNVENIPARQLTSLEEFIRDSCALMGYNFYSPTLIFYFDRKQPFTFVIPGNLLEFACIVRLMIEKTKPWIVTVAIPDYDKAIVYGEHITGKAAKMEYAAPFEYGQVGFKIHRLYSRPFQLPMPLKSQRAIAEKFANDMIEGALRGGDQFLRPLD
jgi:hypothetical protein